MPSQDWALPGIGALTKLLFIHSMYPDLSGVEMRVHRWDLGRCFLLERYRAETQSAPSDLVAQNPSTTF